MKTLVAEKVCDATTRQPGCEMDDKVERLNRIAELVGVDVSEVLA
jgi:hypothetical protein